MTKGAANRRDGFSVAASLAAGVPEAIALWLSGQEQPTPVWLLSFGAEPEVPLRLHVVADGTSDASLLPASPMRPLQDDTDYVAVVLDEVQPRGLPTDPCEPRAQSPDPSSRVSYQSPWSW